METIQCDDCEKLVPYDDLKPVGRLIQRVAPGEPMPYGECPECGGLCHEVTG